MFGIDLVVWVAIIGVVVAAASTAYSLYQQSEQVGAQNEYQRRLAVSRDDQIQRNYELAVSSANNQYRQDQTRQLQEQEAASQKLGQSRVEGMEAQSKALTAAGEAGVSGLSVKALLNDFMGQEAKYRESVKTNAGFQVDQLQEEMQGIRASAEGRINSVSRYVKEPVATPNYFGGAMRVGGSALDAYTRYNAGLNKSDTGYSGADAGYGQAR
jgi:hypothetical protein